MRVSKGPGDAFEQVRPSLLNSFLCGRSQPDGPRWDALTALEEQQMLHRAFLNLAVLLASQRDEAILEDLTAREGREFRVRASPRGDNRKVEQVGSPGARIDKHAAPERIPGEAPSQVFLKAIEEALVEVEKRVPERIADQVEALLRERRAV